MALSDDVLADPARMRRVKTAVEAIARGARAAFLVDEGGTPFATVGHVEFRLPHPLAGLEDDAAGAVLGALVGEPRGPSPSSVVVERLSARALLVLVLPRPPSARERRSIRNRSRGLSDLL
jgi:hypothetical protein